MPPENSSVWAGRGGRPSGTSSGREAVIGRIGDVASKLPDDVIENERRSLERVKGMRIVVDHEYHAVDYNIVWETLRDDMPKLGTAIMRWRELHLEITRAQELEQGPDLGL